MKSKKNILIGFVSGIFIVGVGLGVYFLYSKESDKKSSGWEYKSKNDSFDMTSLGGGGVKNSAPSMSKNESLGFSTGGAKDINNFRQNIKNNYLPIPTDITYEGLFYDYFFDTGAGQECKELFCPSYSQAVSINPLSENKEYFLTVGLNSNIKKEDFIRKKLNLVITMDISGSMGSAFSNYYYDDPKKEQDKDSDKQKIEIANESVVRLLDHLNKDDSFGMVLFDDEAYLGKKISQVKDTDMKALKKNILDIEEKGGTNIEAGYKKATGILDDYEDADSDKYENRIILLTDAMPNIGQTNDSGLAKMIAENAKNKIYTTIIGVGVDFNTELVELIMKTRGANYYSVHSSKEFYNQMDKSFDYMVTPLVFNLDLKLESEGYEIKKIYGSPEANQATGELMKINTLFPSETEDGETKGGIVLIQLDKKNDKADSNVKLSVSYENRAGKKFNNSQTIKFNSKEIAYDNNGIRKAILLTRYANLMKAWVIDERKDLKDSKVNEKSFCNKDDNCLPKEDYKLGQWERQSNKLQVSSYYKEMIVDFKKYFEQENKVLNDKTLDQEKELMELLVK